MRLLSHVLFALLVFICKGINHGIERQKSIEKELDCKFIRIIPDKENFNFLKL